MQRPLRALMLDAATVMFTVTALASLLPGNAIAQSSADAPAEIHGRVVGTDGAAVDRVTVSLLGVSDVVTDSAGVFGFVSLSPGTYFLRATRLGNAPVLKNITVAAGERVRVDITLNPIVHQLTAFVVRADSAVTAVNDPTGFERRRRMEQGVFMTEEQIERRRAISTEQLFLALPNVRVDTGGIVLIDRGIISYKRMLLGPGPTQFSDQFIDCVGVQVFVDGAMMPQPFDVNTIPPQRIKSIELYRGPATTPLELRTPKTVCGTLAIWTR
jgi:Carboxypeptidase regulatory-like domain/TonB-dependent Receptor Plug Domain